MGEQSTDIWGQEEGRHLQGGHCVFSAGASRTQCWGRKRGLLRGLYSSTPSGGKWAQDVSSNAFLCSILNSSCWGPFPATLSSVNTKSRDPSYPSSGATLRHVPFMQCTTKSQSFMVQQFCGRSSEFILEGQERRERRWGCRKKGEGEGEVSARNPAQTLGFYFILFCFVLFAFKGRTHDIWRFPA